MLIVANLAAVAAIAILYSYLRLHRDESTSQLAAALFCFFPVSLYLSAGYAEAMSLALAVTCFWFLARERLNAASLVCGLATATRPTGVVLLVPLAYSLWPREFKFASTMKLVARLGLGCSGLLAYMIYLGLKFNDPFAFVTGQLAWIHCDVPWSVANIVKSFTDALPQSSAVFNFVKVDLWMFILFVTLAIATRKLLEPTEFLYSAAFLLFVSVFQLYEGQGFCSMSRQLLMIFPIFIGAAELIKKRAATCAAILLGSAVGLFWSSALIAQWYWVE